MKKRRSPAGRRNERRAEDLFPAFAALSEEESRAGFLETHPGLCNSEVASALAREANQVAKENPRQALGFARAAATVARRLDDLAPLGESLRAEANVLFALNDHRAAVERHDLSLIHI